MNEQEWERLMRQETMEGWASYMQEVGAVVVDVETTGPSSQDEIIDFSIVRAGDGVVLFDSLIKPQEKIKYQAYRIHGISEDDLKDAPCFVDVFEEINDILHLQNAIAYNSPFDERLTNVTCDRYGLARPSANWRCLMKAYKQYMGYARNVSLVQACEDMSVRAGNHRAKTDALAAARVMYRMAQGYGK